MTARSLPDPAVVVTVYDDTALRRSQPILAALARDAAPGDLAVCLHTTPDDSDRAAVDVVRALGLRLWWGLPYDGVARTLRKSGGTVARALAATWARKLGAWSPEVVCLDGEALWKPDAAADLATLGALALDVIAATRAEIPGAAVSWTSYDHPLWHHLPWGAILGAGGVDLHAPQVYAAPESGVSDHRAAASRLASARRQWSALADAHAAVRRELLPGGERCTVYGQIHHVTTGGAALVLDASDTSRAWALPTRSDDAGVAALRALLLARRATGRSAGAIARWQRAHGLAADGVAGPATIASLGMTP